MDDHYELLTDVDYTGDVDEDDWNRVTKTVRRALGELMQKVMYAGCLTTSGWRITTGKTIGAGEGIVDECYCQTTSATDISGLLTNGAKNYVWLVTNSDSATDGAVVAQASLAPVAPAYACKLGSITLDALGAVTHVDNDDEDFLRDYSFPLRWRRVQFNEVVNIPLSTYADLEVDHSADVTFNCAFCPVITSIDDGCRAVLQLNGTTQGKFTVRVYNDGEYTYGYGYEYGYGTLEEVHIVGERWGV